MPSHLVRIPDHAHNRASLNSLRDKRLRAASAQTHVNPPRPAGALQCDIQRVPMCLDAGARRSRCGGMDRNLEPTNRDDGGIHGKRIADEGPGSMQSLYT